MALKLTRKNQEEIHIIASNGETAVVTIADLTQQTRVAVVIDAPPQVRIIRSELLEKPESEKAA